MPRSIAVMPPVLQSQPRRMPGATDTAGHHADHPAATVHTQSAREYRQWRSTADAAAFAAHGLLVPAAFPASTPPGMRCQRVFGGQFQARRAILRRRIHRQPIEVAPFNRGNAPRRPARSLLPYMIAPCDHARATNRCKYPDATAERAARDANGSINSPVPSDIAPGARARTLPHNRLCLRVLVDTPGDLPDHSLVNASAQPARTEAAVRGYQ
ncbi:hypothetical protein OBG91_15780 [Lactococcus lactis]|nr:hypothetical protein [Lactococcus lactis]